jgi:hypothetical protein
LARDDDRPDRLPVDPRQPARRRLVGLGRQPRDEILEVARKARAVTDQRDALDMHAVLRKRSRRSRAETSKRQRPRSRCGQTAS